MRKILIIIWREYITRVRKRTFVLMTIFSPLLFGTVTMLPVWLGKEQDRTWHVVVVDETHMLSAQFLPSNPMIFLEFSEQTISSAIKWLPDSYADALLHVSEQGETISCKLYAHADVSGAHKEMLQNWLFKSFLEARLARDPKLIGAMDELNAQSTLSLFPLPESMAATDEKRAAITGYVASVLVYMFVFLYGAQVMRGVSEEKSGRIVEIIISSVRPFELLMGKIIGIAWVALTQFSVWLLITIVVIMLWSSGIESNAEMRLIEDAMSGQSSSDFASGLPSILTSWQGVSPWVIIGAFAFYFLGGYLLYGAMFGIIGAAVNHSDETQQFVLPVTLPLFVSLLLLSTIMNNPDSNLSFWLSVIPFTSPVSMMMRIPFGVPTWQLLLSGLVLFVSFLFATWFAGRIYKVAILAQGARVGYGTLIKWFFEGK